MNELPELALIKVFNYLPLYDQLTFRKVCKLWKQIIEDNISNSRKELVLLHRMLPRPLVWSHNNQQVNLDNSIIVNVKFVLYDNFRPLFKNIRRLFIVYYGYLIDMEEQLNDFIAHFTKLEHIQIQSLFFCFDDLFTLKIDFELPNLKTLYLGQTDKVISLNCPNLTKLALFDDFEMCEKYAVFKNSLKFLKVKSFAYQPGYALPNLEVLYFCSNLQIKVADFEKLVEIHFYYQKHELLTNQREAILNDLLEQKRELRRDRLDIYHDGIRCAIGSVREIIMQHNHPDEVLCHQNPISKNDLRLYLENQDHFKIENLIKTFDYTSAINEDINSLNEALTEQLARTIVNLRIIEPLNDDQLHSLKLRNLLRYVRFIFVTKLPQNQLDMLPDIVPSILFFTCIRPEQFRNRNFLFLARFKSLKDLRMDEKLISLNEFDQLLTDCRFLISIKVLPPGIQFWKMKGRKFRIQYLDSGKELTFLTKDELLAYMKQNNLLKKKHSNKLLSKLFHR